MWKPAFTWERWEPVYEAIRADFSFDRGADAFARDELGGLLGGSQLSPDDLPECRDRCVGVIGAGPNLPEEMDTVDQADVVFSASAASGILLDRDRPIDLHVTDLDEGGKLLDSIATREIPLAIHAHGDNRAAIARELPRIPPTIVFPTTQVAPTPVVKNPGGFSDGDRAAFLATALGADSLVFAGWAFDDPTVGPIKHQKLQWAQRLLHWLERYRDERFDILDGRRSQIDLGAFPNV